MILLCKDRSTGYLIHPRHRTFVSTGSDGIVFAWDSAEKWRLLLLPNKEMGDSPFNKAGKKPAVGVKYGWERREPLRRSLRGTRGKRVRSGDK